VSGVNGSVAPSLAESFGLGDAGIAALYAGLGLSCLGSLALGREADRVGRRRLLLLCARVLPAAALGAALAPRPELYLLAQLVAYAAGGALLATVSVVITEAAPEDARARRQSAAGTAFAAGTALPLLAAALLPGIATGVQPWRLVWAVAALPALALPALTGRLCETPRWRVASDRGDAPRSRMTDVFEARYRARTLAVLAAVVLVQGVDLATRTWLLYHPVRALGLDVSTATALLVAGGGLGLVGFRLGGHLADRVGRRATFSCASTLFAVSALAYYWGSLHVRSGHAALLGVALFGLAAGGNAAMVAFRALATELFPTRLRGTLGGWLGVAGSLGWMLAMGATSLLAGPLGGVGPAVALIVVFALPAASLCLASLPETAGLDLERAALEA
jgi:MFS family permease